MKHQKQMQNVFLLLVGILFCIPSFGQLPGGIFDTIVNLKKAMYTVLNDCASRGIATDSIYLYSAETQNGGSQDSWFIFVDEEPQKGWCHSCSMYEVGKTLIKDAIVFERTPLTLPPTGFSYVLLRGRNLYSDKANMKPHVPVSIPSQIGTNGLSAAQHTYAVIISGGVSPAANYERYWNDCSFIYQTLVNKYLVPKSNISLLMSDGTDSGSDMLKADWSGYVSQPLDLDFDGTDDIQYSATLTNVSAVFNSLASTLTEDDHLFVFVMDHGGYSNNAGASYICLWGYQRLYDTALADMLDDINAGSISVVLGQCFSGGFVDNLEGPGRVIMTACADDEPSWACDSIPYDEFVYHWTCAMNGMTPDSVAVAGDLNHNGFTTMREAFRYAQSHDNCEETPQYSSEVASTGDDLAFDYIPEGVDLYIRDAKDDTGVEPYNKFDTRLAKYWNSPDIFLRNNPDGDIFQTHQELVPHPSGHSPYIYVRIHNRGTKTYTANNKYLHVYWAASNLNITRGQIYSLSDATGGFLTPIPLVDNIPAGDSTLVQVEFTIPPVISNKLNNGEYYELSILAMVNDVEYEDSTLLPHNSKDIITVAKKKNIAQKSKSLIKIKKENDNYTVIPKECLLCADRDTFSVRSMELHLDSDEDFDFTKAKISVELGDSLYTSWHNGGESGEGIVQSFENNRKLFLVTDSSRISNIVLSPYTSDSIKVGLEFLTNDVDSTQNYVFDLVQRDEATGEIIGGRTYQIEWVSESDSTQISPNRILRAIYYPSTSEMTITLADPVVDPTVARLYFVTDTNIETIEYVFPTGSSSGSVPIPSSYQGIILIHLLQNNELVSTKTYIKS